MTFSDHQAPMLPKRYFWRRGAAGVIDFLVFGCLAGLLVMFVSMMLGVNFGVTSLISRSICIPAPETWPVVRQVEQAWPLSAGETRIRQMCHAGYAGVDDYYLYRAATVSNAGGSLLSYAGSRTISVKVDREGNAISATMFPDLSLPLTLFFMGIFNANGGRTLGKKLMSLRICDRHGARIGFQTALLREFLKFPLLPILFAYQLYQWILDQLRPIDVAALVDFVKSPAFLVLSLGPALLTLLWLLLPFVFWRGRTWYDRIAGTQVVRS